MNEEYLNLALKKIPDRHLLILTVAKRTIELTKDFKPLIKTQETNHINIALLEIINDMLTYEFEEKKSIIENNNIDKENITTIEDKKRNDINILKD